MEIKYPNTTVVINDPDGRFKSDVDIVVKLRHDSQQNVFLVSIAPKKVESNNEPKKVAERVYTGHDKYVKGTVKADGNLKFGVDISPEHALSVGYDILMSDLMEGFPVTWDKAMEKYEEENKTK